MARSQAQLSRTSVVPDSDDASLFSGAARTSAAGPDVLSVRLARCGALHASYYDDTWFGVGVASGVDTLVLPSAASPDSWVHESFIGSVKWSGFIRPPVSGVYTFSAAAEGAASVSLRGQTVIDFPLESTGAKIVRGTIQVPLPSTPHSPHTSMSPLPTPRTGKKMGWGGPGGRGGGEAEGGGGQGGWVGGREAAGGRWRRLLGLQGFYLTESVFKVVLQKSTPPQIRQFILYISKYKE